VKHTRGWFGGLAVLCAVSFVAVSCGQSKSSGSGSGTTTTAAATESCGTLPNKSAPNGGELIDYAQLNDAGTNTSFDPSVVQSLDESQITSAVWDGLTDFDYTQKCSPVLKGLLASKWTSNSDATQFTFDIKKDQKFSNGDPVLPSSFKLGWERMGNPKTASPYQYLIEYIKGGADFEAGKVATLDAIKADDQNMTLTVDLSAPNADFPSIVSMQEWSPIDKTDFDKVQYEVGWGKGITIGNGPYMIQKADDQSVVLVPNPHWSGDVYGTKKVHLSKITFMISQDVTSAFQAFQSGEGDNATIPPGQYKAVLAQYPDTNTVKSPTLGTYYFDFGFSDPQLGGAANLKLRQAISLAIDRDEVNNKAYEGTRVISSGITPPGIPGFKENLCKYCKTDTAEAKKLYDEWTAAGGKLTKPITIQYNPGGGHDTVVQVIQADLKQVLGIESTPAPITEHYFRDIAKPGACVLCRSGWYADYPTYGNFMVDLFSKKSIGLNNFGGFDDPKFEDLIAKAQAEIDPVKRGDLYNEAEQYLLNDQTAAVPLNWYTGDQVYSKSLINFDQPPLGQILWQRVGKSTSGSST
jgi:ABC-type oligopeptide transport system substrate-binding subunit